MASPSSTSHQQGLPSISSLTNGLPPSNAAQQYAHGDQAQGEHLRDSGTWPQPHSKHNSVNSQGLHVRTLLNPDDSPPRSSVPNTPQSARIPATAQSGGSQLPSINQGFQDSAQRASADYAAQESRRSSVDSRMHTGFNNLYINQPHSPYESNNNSQVSLAASLRRPNGGVPMSPQCGRSSLRGQPPMRVAPQIMPVARGPGAPDPTAAKPTQGFAWAFPDGPIPEERRGSDSGESSIGVSRNNSIAASSIRSSIFSTDSQMPHGQRRLEDDPTTHHHTMQHRAVANLQSESGSAAGLGNYSRTPELRVSHKLAERKRRSEMKDLFDDLNKAVPNNGGTKASKWEILSKAIEYIRNLQNENAAASDNMRRLARDADYAREAHKENEMLKNELRIMQTNLQRLDPNTSHVYGPYSQQLTQQGGPPPSAAVSLPPIGHGAHQGPPPPAGYGNGVQGQPPAGAMQGVEYGYGR